MRSSRRRPSNVVRPAREHVALEAEAGDPERVDDVDRREVEAHATCRRAARARAARRRVPMTVTPTSGRRTATATGTRARRRSSVGVRVDLVDRPRTTRRDREQDDDDEQRDERVDDLDRDVLVLLAAACRCRPCGGGSRSTMIEHDDEHADRRGEQQEHVPDVASMSSACSVSGGSGSALPHRPSPRPSTVSTRLGVLVSASTASARRSPPRPIVW